MAYRKRKHTYGGDMSWFISVAVREYSQIVSFARVRMMESKPAVFVEDVELFSIQIARTNGSA